MIKIVSFCNYDYRDLAVKWSMFLNKNNITNYTVYALDYDTFNHLQQNNVNTELLPCMDNWFTDKKYYWFSRFLKLYSLLSAGHDIVHSDLDAIWLKNPLKYIEPEIDMVCSTGGHPEEIRKQYGYNICMGWVYFKSNNNIIKLFKNIIDKQETRSEQITFDDQTTINNYIFKMITQNKTYTNLSEYHDIMTGDIKIRFLKDKIATRGLEINQDTHIYHPLLPNNTWINNSKYTGSGELNIVHMMKIKNIW